MNIEMCIVNTFFLSNPFLIDFAGLENKWLIVCHHLKPYPNPKLQDKQNK